jgi:antitoxin component of RelBE/YafQ-DinJ toxin-antitoxin module
MSTVVISVRIRREVKEVLDEAGINVSEVVRNYLEDLARRIRVQRALNELDAILSNIKPAEKGFAERLVREDRDSH